MGKRHTPVVAKGVFSALVLVDRQPETPVGAASPAQLAYWLQRKILSEEEESDIRHSYDGRIPRECVAPIFFLRMILAAIEGGMSSESKELAFLRATVRGALTTKTSRTLALVFLQKVYSAVAIAHEKLDWAWFHASCEQPYDDDDVGKNNELAELYAGLSKPVVPDLIRQLAAVQLIVDGKRLTTLSVSEKQATAAMKKNTDKAALYLAKCMTHDSSLVGKSPCYPCEHVHISHATLSDIATML